MKTVTNLHPFKKYELVFYAFGAIFITAYLFYLDEGLFNYNWTGEPGNWFLLFMYAIPVFLVQLLISKLILKNRYGLGKILLSMILGCFIGLGIEILLFSL